MEKVVIVTVTYGNRWKHLSQAVDAVIHDLHLEKLIIVDNGSKNAQELDAAREKFSTKIEIIRTGKNLGSAGGFALGLTRARNIECDYVLMLDDDNVLEPNGLSVFIHAYKAISGKHVISGFRPDIQSEEVFRLPSDESELKYTFFDVWNLTKVKKLLFKQERQQAYRSPVKTRGFVYGGAFLPIEAVKAAPLPDKDLVLYGDDVEYSWGVLDKGYASYLCDRPIIRDVDMSFEEGDHIYGLFNPTSPPFKVYYRIRNMVRISLRNSTQYRIALHTSIFIWIAGLFVLALLRYGPSRITLSRMKLILQAVYGGYMKHASVPQQATLP